MGVRSRYGCLGRQFGYSGLSTACHGTAYRSILSAVIPLDEHFNRLECDIRITNGRLPLFPNMARKVFALLQVSKRSKIV